MIKFERAIKANPEYSSVYNRLGLCYRELDKLDEAIFAFEKARNLKD
jgi:tetratricopeptide (TPR) repeat protein